MHISFILYFFALGISLVCSAPLDAELLPRSGSINFEGCSAGEQTLINFYLKDMVKLATAGAASTEVAPGTESDTYKAWWGAQSSEGLINERLNSRFEKLAGFLNNPRKDIYFNCVSGTGCTGTRWVEVLDHQSVHSEPALESFFSDITSDSPAGTDRSSQRIYLCPGSFWYMPMTRLSGIAAPSRKCTDIGLYRGTAAVLLHELTHALFFSTIP
jgi:hypothetical protein